MENNVYTQNPVKKFKRQLIWLLLTILFLYTDNPIANAENQISSHIINAQANKKAFEAIQFFRSYLSIPNNPQKPDHIVKLSNWLENEFTKRGFKVSRLATSKNPLILAERQHSGAKKTALIYLQADGQPVDPSEWDQENPYLPVLKQYKNNSWEAIPWERLEKELNPNWRIFARSASDSKGPNIQFLVALDILKSLGIEPDYNLKVVIDTEEELGSPSLPEAVYKNRQALSSDMLLIFDGPPHRSNKPTIVFGARGIAKIKLTTYGPNAPQHSGHFGNYAPNPAFHLSRILSSMKSEDGRVLIAGYYDGITISPETKKKLDAVPNDEERIKENLGFLVADAVGDNLELSVQYPSLNITGLSSAWTGDQGRTIVPSEAVAELDIRLVKESNPQRLINLIKNHVSALGYTVIDHSPTNEDRKTHNRLVKFEQKIYYDAFRTDYDSNVGQLTTRALTHLNKTAPILIRTAGGSIPISPFIKILGIPAVVVPTVNPDNNQHSPNENLRLGNFIDGIATITAVLAEKVEQEVN